MRIIIVEESSTLMGSPSRTELLTTERANQEVMFSPRLPNSFCLSKAVCVHPPRRGGGEAEHYDMLCPTSRSIDSWLTYACKHQRMETPHTGESRSRAYLTLYEEDRRSRTCSHQQGKYCSGHRPHCGIQGVTLRPRRWTKGLCWPRSALSKAGLSRACSVVPNKRSRLYF